VNISKTVADTAKVTINDYSKSHMGFRLAPRSMTLDDLELHKFEFSVNFSEFRRFRTQLQLNASIISDNVVSTSNWSNFWQAFASRMFIAIAGLSCSCLYPYTFA